MSDGHPIEQLSQLLREQQMDLDAELLADVLWLATQMDQAELTPANAIPQPDDPQTPESVPPRPDLRPPLPDIAPPPSVPLTPPEPEASSSEEATGLRSGGVPVQTPAAPALRQSLALGRSLRPLMQKVPSRVDYALDEDATANYVAERKICIPVLRPCPERWLRLALVIEETPSTTIWKDTIREFQTLLERQGAFRDVRTWYLRQDEQGELRLLSKPNVPIARQRPRSPKELLDPSGRCLVLLMSDCTSSAWQRGTIHHLLQLWMRDNPVTLVQLLPERFWERSVLGEGVAVPLGSLVRGEKNARFRVLGKQASASGLVQSVIKLPVVTLDPEPLLQWAKVTAGFGNAQTPGILFEAPDLTRDESSDDDQLPDFSVSPHPISLDAESRVKQFENTASPEAKRLAGLLAAVPVTLPIIHLVQETLLPQSRQSHVAEVLMSGLFQSPVSGREQPGREVDQVWRYEFVDGVRDHLIAPPFVSISEVDRVLEAVSQYIARKAGLSIRSFTALLALRPHEEGVDHPEVQAFARISRNALRRLGPEYAELVDALGETARTPVLQRGGDIPPLEDFDYITPILSFEPPQSDGVIGLTPEVITVEVVTLHIEDEPAPQPTDEALEPFSIRIATLERRGREWEVVHQTGEAHRFIESLPNDINLEMVAIPAGDFWMGCSEDEPRLYKNELPRHRVSVSSFLISKYPITQVQWKEIANLLEINQKLNPDPSNFKGDQLPVEQISWQDAVEFCERLSRYTNRSYRLPTECEWEYACRAGTSSSFHFGETITPELANYKGNYSYRNGPKGINRRETTPVGLFSANRFGLFDMHGNVSEWCIDRWHDNYEGAPNDGHFWVSGSSNLRVLRGGSWNSHPGACRSSYRLRLEETKFYKDIGIRVCLTF